MPVPDWTQSHKIVCGDRSITPPLILTVNGCEWSSPGLSTLTTSQYQLDLRTPDHISTLCSIDFFAPAKNRTPNPGLGIVAVLTPTMWAVTILILHIYLSSLIPVFFSNCVDYFQTFPNANAGNTVGRKRPWWYNTHIFQKSF